MPEANTHECARCARDFPEFDPHTEIVRRDFVEEPHPPQIERFCRDCWEAYVTEFVGDSFEDLLDSYTSE